MLFSNSESKCKLEIFQQNTSSCRRKNICKRLVHLFSTTLWNSDRIFAQMFYYKVVRITNSCTKVVVKIDTQYYTFVQDLVIRNSNIFEVERKALINSFGIKQGKAERTLYNLYIYGAVDFTVSSILSDRYLTYTFSIFF